MKKKKKQGTKGTKCLIAKYEEDFQKKQNRLEIDRNEWKRSKKIVRNISIGNKKKVAKL